jgi:hypothetical protein
MVLTPPDSPAKNTRSQKRALTSSDDEVVIIVPKKQRKTARRILTDEEIWDKPDEEILGECIDRIRNASLIELADVQSRMQDIDGDTYGHYKMSVVRDENATISGASGRKQINIMFTCKANSSHTPHFRPRIDTSTGNLRRGIKTCIKNRSIGSGSNQLDLHQVHSEYTFQKHRVLIALHCADSKRPFNYVKDCFYMKQVELLRRGTKLPDPTTVSRDVHALYRGTAKIIRDRLKVGYHN